MGPGVTYRKIKGDPEPRRNCKKCNYYKKRRIVLAVALAVVSLCLITATVLAVQVLKAQPQLVAWCPDGWLGYQGKCYYFSEAEENWNNSQRRCFALGASLAVIDSEQDLAFMMRYKGISEHWIGLWREQEGQPWKWVNGSDFNSSGQRQLLQRKVYELELSEGAILPFAG